jgi:23S rRNA (adenine2503-C2)-methyltransferase
MKILETSGNDDLAKVYVAALDNNNERIVEFVESVQPPVPRNKKMVFIVSTMLGCPVECLMCDAGGNFSGKLSKSEIMEQIEFLVKKHFNGNKISIPKLKIQFARMGEPAFNPAVIEVMSELPEKYNAPGLMPCISTIAPTSATKFFNNLLVVKDKYYHSGNFQLQFSIHTTNPAERDRIMPCKKWDFEQIAKFGEDWYKPGDRKITLNFAPMKGLELDPKIVRTYFDPDKFAIELTPVNPTYRKSESGLESRILDNDSSDGQKLKTEFENLGYDVILSIGELAENQIGSNCGFYVSRLKRNQTQ